MCSSGFPKTQAFALLRGGSTRNLSVSLSLSESVSMQHSQDDLCECWLQLRQGGWQAVKHCEHESLRPVNKSKWGMHKLRVSSDTLLFCHPLFCTIVVGRSCCLQHISALYNDLQGVTVGRSYTVSLSLRWCLIIATSGYVCSRDCASCHCSSFR